MHIQKIFLSVAIIVFLFVSCKKDSNTSTPAGGDCTNSFTFLKNGAVLTYNSYGFFGDTTVETITFASTAQAGVYSSLIKNVTDNTTLGQRYMKGCNGWLTSSDVINVSDTLKYMKETRSLGDTWVYYDPQYHDYNDYTVYKKDVSVKVAAGTFKCDELLYYQEGTINTDTLWWNNSYSIIKYSGFLSSYELASKNY